MRSLSGVDVSHRSVMAPFHNAFLQLASAVIVLRGDSIVDCNQGAVSLWQAQDKEFLLKKEGYQLIFTTKSPKALFLNLKNSCIQSGSYRADILIRTFKGEIHHVDVSLLAWVKEGQEPIIYLIATVLMPYKAASKELGSHKGVGRDNNVITLKSPLYKEAKRNIGLTADRYGVINLDILNQVIVFEKKICEFIGIFNTNISDTSFVISYKDFIDRYVYQEDKPRVMERLYSLNPNSSANTLLKIRLDFVLVNDLGQTRRVRILCKPLIEEDGSLKVYHGVLQDYSEQEYFQSKINKYKASLEILIKKRTQQLSLSQANLSNALDFANLSIWEYDSNYQVFKVSGKMFLGEDSEEHGLMDKVLSISEIENLLVHDDWLVFKDMMDYLLKEAKSGHTEYLEIRTKPNNKQYKHYYLNAKCTLDEHGVQKIHGTIQDITQIKRTQDENVRLIEMVEASSDIIVVANKEIELEYINKAGKVFMGLEDSLSTQRNASERFEKILHSAKGGVIKAMKNGSWNGEALVTRYDGVVIPFSVQIIAHTSNRQIKFISAVFRNLVDQKRTEEDLLRKNKDLDTFLYRSSHDFRAPITTLIGLGKLAKMEIKDKEALKYIDMFEDQFERLHKLNVNITRLIGIDKASAFEGKRVEFNSQEMVDKVIKELSLRYDISQARFETEACEKIVYWPKAFEMLSIAVFNLVENAIQFKKRGEKAFVKIKIENVVQHNSLRIEVTDNGVGMPEEVKSRIFEMFYRGNLDSKGSGIGLFKVRKVVEKLNGSIEVNSTIGEGSSFILKLPLANKST
ncbi:HAMP domain-containing sensor histidine kinase [Cytophagales bacterium LB-30]|uniref:histidine kinase n=1 Tax=Shiella aurantiaca TaxID=3058365 RepID=A0ABT8F3I6_9BACT|nr:HAMP domain-containing sensor histidine kinase [Shiella aurantiaca]MDN4164786.1 HAMP domain-containing sensor histidine kinase [Shiella aurantiaca]